MQLGISREVGSIRRTAHATLVCFSTNASTVDARHLVAQVRLGAGRGERKESVPW